MFLSFQVFCISILSCQLRTEKNFDLTASRHNVIYMLDWYRPDFKCSLGLAPVKNGTIELFFFS